MDIEIARKGEIILAKIIGEIDHHTAEEVRRQLDGEIVSPGSRGLIFDLSALTFMDTSGIGVMVGRYKNMMRLGGSTAIAGMNKQTKRVLTLTGFGRFLPFFDNVENAIEYIEKNNMTGRSGDYNAKVN